MRKCKMHKLRLVLVISIIFVAGIMSTSCKSQESTESNENTRQTAKEQQTKENDASDSQITFGTFTSQTLDGTAVSQDIFQEAELTMVNVWGTFCGPCIGEMPDLGEISREYEDKGFQIVGMLCDVSKPGDETALEIVDATQADYTHIVLSADLQNGILGQVQVVPTTIFVDSNGSLVGDIYTGSRDKESWLKLIEEIREEVAR